MDGTERRLLDRARELEEAIASCHERVACPKCGEPVGVQCRKLSSRGLAIGRRVLDPVRCKHSHVERLRAAGISLR